MMNFRDRTAKYGALRWWCSEQARAHLSGLGTAREFHEWLRTPDVRERQLAEALQLHVCDAGLTCAFPWHRLPQLLGRKLVRIALAVVLVQECLRAVMMPRHMCVKKYTYALTCEIQCHKQQAFCAKNDEPESQRWAFNLICSDPIRPLLNVCD